MGAGSILICGGGIAALYVLAVLPLPPPPPHIAVMDPAPMQMLYSTGAKMQKCRMEVGSNKLLFSGQPLEVPCANAIKLGQPFEWCSASSWTKH